FMAGCALGFVVEQGKAALGLIRDCVFVAIDPVVERRALRYNRPLVSRNRLGNRLRLQTFLGEDAVEQRLLLWNGPQTLQQLVQWHIHCAGRLNRPERLFLQRGETSVPHEDISPRRIDDCRRAPRELGHAVTNTQRQSVAPTKARTVATRAGLSRAYR